MPDGGAIFRKSGFLLSEFAPINGHQSFTVHLGDGEFLVSVSFGNALKDCPRCVFICDAPVRGTEKWVRVHTKSTVILIFRLRNNSGCQCGTRR